MKKATDELLKILKHDGLESYVSDNEDEFITEPLSRYIGKMIEEKNMTNAEVIARSGIQVNYAYQILSGQKKPSRDKVIALCFGMRLSVDETQTLLKYGGYARLYPRNKRDSVIIFALQNRDGIIDCNLKLDSFNLSPL